MVPGNVLVTYTSSDTEAQTWNTEMQFLWIISDQGTKILQDTLEKYNNTEAQNQNIEKQFTGWSDSLPHFFLGGDDNT